MSVTQQKSNAVARVLSSLTTFEMAYQISNLLRTRNFANCISGRNVRLISTFSFLCQEPLLAAEQEQGSESASALPPNPATGSPLYNENWRSPVPFHSPASSSASSILPVVGFSHRQSHVRNLDADTLLSSFAGLMTASGWFDIKNQFEVWIRSLDSRGKPNRPTAELYNYYLRANQMMGASVAELLDMVSKMEDFAISPNTASFNIVLESMVAANECDAAEKMLDRMEAYGESCSPNDESYDLVMKLLFRNNKVDAAFKHVDEALNRHCILSSNVFNNCISTCLKQKMLDKLTSILERCKSMDGNQTQIIGWTKWMTIANAAVNDENPKLAHVALEFIFKFVIKSQIPGSGRSLVVDELFTIQIMKLAARSFNSNLLDLSWAVHRRSLRHNKPSQSAYIEKINSYASLGNLERAFAALREFEISFKDLDANSQELLLSPFSTFHPLVVACSSKGFETLDLVYFQLESLSRLQNPYKSLTALNCVILGCANIWDLVRAYQTFEAISSSFGLKPNVHSYNCLMYAYGRQKGISETEKVFNHMISAGIKPNYMSYSLLVDAHLAVRDLKSALSVVEKLVSAGFEPNSEMLLKIKRRCIRELDYESNDVVHQLEKRFNLRLRYDTSLDLLFTLDYSTNFN